VDLTFFYLYSEVALTQNWTILSTRTGGGFWRFLPGWQLVLAILTVDIVASIMVLFRTFVDPISILAVVRIWLYCVGVFLFVDFCNIILTRSRSLGNVWSSKRGKDKALLKPLEDRVFVLAKISDMHEVASNSWKGKDKKGHDEEKEI